MHVCVMGKYGLVVQKKEMTRMWVNDAFAPVTLLAVPSQEVVRYKTDEKDWYTALVVGVEKEISDKKKGMKVSYTQVTEFPVDTDFMQKYAAGAVLDGSVLEGIQMVAVEGSWKGKGFQGGMKRYHLKWGNKTRGSKFHRWIGSMGNRKPRRTQKGHPHAGRMGWERTVLKNRSIINTFTDNGQHFVAIKGSVPGAYNGLLKLYVS